MVVRARAYPHKERQIEFIGKFYRASGGLFIAERRNPIGKELLWDYVRKDLRIPVSIGTQVTDFVRFLFGNPCARNRVSILGCVGLGTFQTSKPGMQLNVSPRRCTRDQWPASTMRMPGARASRDSNLIAQLFKPRFKPGPGPAKDAKSNCPRGRPQEER